jgi:hypothetical protein
MRNGVEEALAGAVMLKVGKKAPPKIKAKNSKRHIIDSLFSCLS